MSDEQGAKRPYAGYEIVKGISLERWAEIEKMAAYIREDVVDLGDGDYRVEKQMIDRLLTAVFGEEQDK